MCSALRNGDSLSPVPSQEAKERPSGVGVAASSRRSAQVTAAGVSSFQTQSIEEGRRGGSVPTQPPRAVHPPARCQHATCVHVLCCGIGENNSHHTCTPTAETQSKNNNKVKAVAQSVLPSPSSLLYSKSIHTEMSCLGKE